VTKKKRLLPLEERVKGAKHKRASSFGGKRSDRCHFLQKTSEVRTTARDGDNGEKDPEPKEKEEWGTSSGKRKQELASVKGTSEKPGKCCWRQQERGGVVGMLGKKKRFKKMSNS